MADCAVFTGSNLRGKTVGLGFSLICFVLTTGCNALDFAPLATATRTVSEVFETGESPSIVVETFNGSIDISPGKNDEVVAEVVKRASGLNETIAEEALDGIQVSMVQSGDTIHITARRIGNWNGNSGAAVVIAVPVKAKLQLKTSNGRVICEGLQGGIEAITSNGNVEIVEGRGHLDLSTSNGNVNIEATDALVATHTSNGRIEFRGSLTESKHHFRTSNGNIELVLPADSQFAVDGSTSNARIECDFPVRFDGKKRRTRLQGNVGDNPIRTIGLSSSNGNIAIRKARADD